MPRTLRPDVLLRAIELMLASIDERLPDESLAPMPYEVSPAELRDVVRLSKGVRPLTKQGRLALTRAIRERMRGVTTDREET